MTTIRLHEIAVKLVARPVRICAQSGINHDVLRDRQEPGPKCARVRQLRQAQRLVGDALEGMSE